VYECVWSYIPVIVLVGLWFFIENTHVHKYTDAVKKRAGIGGFGYGSVHLSSSTPPGMQLRSTSDD
jgi:hypothetical protein